MATADGKATKTMTDAKRELEELLNKPLQQPISKKAKAARKLASEGRRSGLMSLEELEAGDEAPQRAVAEPPAKATRPRQPPRKSSPNPSPATHREASPSPAVSGDLLLALEELWLRLMREHRPEVITPRWDFYTRKDVEELIKIYEGGQAEHLKAGIEYLVVKWEPLCERFTRTLSLLPALSLLKRFHGDIVNEGVVWKEIQAAERGMCEALGVPIAKARGAVLAPVPPWEDAGLLARVPAHVSARYVRAMRLKLKYTAGFFED